MPPHKYLVLSLLYSGQAYIPNLYLSADLEDYIIELIVKISNALLRSFYPKDRLVENRDADALWHKYRAGLPGYSRIMESFKGYTESTSFGTDFLVKDLGSITVNARQPSLISGQSAKHAVYMGDDVIHLHVDSFSGAGQLRSDLGVAATYISQHRALRERPYVLGVTYAELARLAVRLGFESMVPSRIDRLYKYDVQAKHSVFCALNGKQRPFSVGAAYLPTPEFVETFMPAESNRPLAPI